MNTPDNKIRYKKNSRQGTEELKGKIKQLRSQINDLEREKYMFRGLLDTIPDNIYFKDRNSGFIMVSKAGIAWFGAKKLEDIIGKTDFDIFTSEHAQEAFDDEQRIMNTNTPLINKEEKETWEDGSVTWVSTSKVPLKDAKNRITGIVGISRNITEKKQTEAKLKRYRENLEKSKQETDNILKNVEEGLFLLDNNLTVASQHSYELIHIMNEKKPANKNFIDLLENKISQNNLELTQRYLDLLFIDKHDETMLEQMNPLTEVEFKNNKQIKYLTFRFRRVRNSRNNITGLIATVNDVTKEVNLARSLAEQKADSKRRMDWLLSILNIDPTMLKEFVASVQDEMARVDRIMQSLVSSKKQKELLEAIYRSIHTIKGNASLLELEFFVEQAHRIEDVIESLREKRHLGTEAKKILSGQVKGIYKTYDELNELIDHISNIQYQFRPKRSYEHQVLIKSIKDLIERLSKKYNKNATLDHKSLSGNIIPYHHRLLIRDILVQLVRNSLYHGLEVPAIRKALKKSKNGRITITGKIRNNNFILIYEDDGRGIDVNRLKKQALSSGRWSESEINKWKAKELLDSIYVQGISTADSADETGGRGVGMNIIKQKIDKIGGHIEIETKQNQFTRFTLTIPSEKR